MLRCTCDPTRGRVCIGHRLYLPVDADAPLEAIWWVGAPRREDAEVAASGPDEPADAPRVRWTADERKRLQWVKWLYERGRLQP